MYCKVLFYFYLCDKNDKSASNNIRKETMIAKTISQFSIICN